MKKYALFRPHFYTSLSALTRLSHTGQKFSKKVFVKEYSPIVKYRTHRSCTNFLNKNFHQYVTVYLVRISIYKTADKKMHAFSRRSKNVKKNGQKLTKNGSNQIFHYTRCSAAKRVTSLRGPSPHQCALVTHLLLKKCGSGGKPLPSIAVAIDKSLPWTSDLPLDRRTRYEKRTLCKLTSTQTQMFALELTLNLTLT